jgi:hypothetical protein
MPADKPDALHRSLVLLTLESMSPQHVWGIARRIEPASRDVLKLNQGPFKQPNDGAVAVVLFIARIGSGRPD